MSVNSLKSAPAPLTGAALSRRATARSVSFVYLCAMAASFLIAYLPTYVSLAKGPWQTEQEGHGPLIMLAAAWLAWQQRGKLASLSLRPAPISGWAILLCSLLLMALTRSQNIDRKSTRLNSSHVKISYAVF